MLLNFEQFVASDHRVLWISEPGIQLYVRKSIHPGLFDLANLTANKPASGAYTRFLKRYEGYAFRVENVVTDRFANYHRRRGWVELPCEYGCPSFLNAEALRRGLGLRKDAIIPSGMVSVLAIP